MLLVTSLLYIDMVQYVELYQQRQIDFVVLVINWVFCICIFAVNLLVAAYGCVCGCCYSKEFEKIQDIMPRDEAKSAFSFANSNKVEPNFEPELEPNSNPNL